MLYLVIPEQTGLITGMTHSPTFELCTLVTFCFVFFFFFRNKNSVAGINEIIYPLGNMTQESEKDLV